MCSEQTSVIKVESSLRSYTLALTWALSVEIQFIECNFSFVSIITIVIIGYDNCRFLIELYYYKQKDIIVCMRHQLNTRSRVDSAVIQGNTLGPLLF